jgi:MFS family permease
MRVAIRDRNIWLVDGAIFLLGLAYGISISIVGIFLKAEGYSKLDIGWLAVAFASGICALALPIGVFIRRFSARATLVACLTGYAAMVTAFPYLPNFASIAAVRFFDGAFSVGIWVSCESILLSRSDEHNKATITSIYAISLALGYVVGPLLAKLIVSRGPMKYAFVASGVLATVSALLVALRLDPDVRADAHAPATGADEPPAGAPSSSLALLARIKTSCFATFSYGYFQASVVLFLPLFLIERKGIEESRTILVPAFFALGMLLFSNVAGRLGDRFGHLRLMTALAAVGTVMIAGFVFLDAFAPMCAAVFVAGATLASISPLSLALQGVVTPRRDLSRANAIYNVFYAAGMLVGPKVSSQIYEASGGAAMLWHLAALWTGFILFTIVFHKDDPAMTQPVIALARR